MSEKPKKRGQKTLGGKGKKKSHKPAKKISFSRMKSGHLKAEHDFGDGNPEEHVVQDGGADDHLEQHLEQPPQEAPGAQAAQGAPAPSPGGMMGAPQ